MGIWRGTKLALVGVVGATLARWFRIGRQLREYEVVDAILQLPVVEPLVAEHGVVVDWGAGVLVGVVVADVVGYLGARNTERDVRFSSTLGVGKGVVAVVVGAVALANDGAVFAEVVRFAPELAEFIRRYLGGPAAFAFAVGVWVGTVVGEVAQL